MQPHLDEAALLEVLTQSIEDRRDRLPLELAARLADQEAVCPQTTLHVGMPLFAGLIPPLCTPLTEHRSIDVASLERLISFQIEAGADGIFVLGSSGEAAYLNDADRCTVVASAVGAVAGPGTSFGWCPRHSHRESD
jgi:hypothetical protein